MAACYDFVLLQGPFMGDDRVAEKWADSFLDGAGGGTESAVNVSTDWTSEFMNSLPPRELLPLESSLSEEHQSFEEFWPHDLLSRHDHTSW